MTGECFLRCGGFPTFEAAILHEGTKIAPETCAALTEPPGMVVAQPLSGVERAEVRHANDD
jgi:hypothetical protein